MIRLAIRYLFSKKRQSLFTLLGIFLGAAGFVIISGFFSGFKHFFIENLVNNSAHIFIQARQDFLEPQSLDHAFFGKDITHVFISHFHADHIASLSDLSWSSFVYMPHAFGHLRGLPPSEDLKHAFLRGLIPSDFDSRSHEVDMSKPVLLSEEYAPFKIGYDLLGDGSIIGVELPGHAHGQMGLFVRDERDKLFFFVADAAWLKQSIVENRPPHKITNLLFPDPKAYRKTLSNLHTYHLTHPETHVIPSHCEETIRAHASAYPAGIISHLT